MSRYDLEQDNPYGIANVDLPVSIYDRPQLALANLLRGDVDGTTRAMLSPSTLTPQQMRTVRDILMPGKKTNPILKTITDIATNPLVIAGLAVGMMKFPLGTTTPILALRNGLLPKASAMGPLLSGLHDAMMNLRSVPGLFERMLKVTRATTDFESKHWLPANDIFKEAGPLSKEAQVQIAARLDGLHRSNHYMVGALHNEPEWVAFMGGKDAPIAEGLDRIMTREAVTTADKLRGWFQKSRALITGNPEVREQMRKAVEKKGLQFGEDVEDYWPHHGDYDKYYKRSLRGVTGVKYRNWVRKQVAEKVGREEVQRRGGMFIDPAEMRELEAAGAVRKGFTDSVLEPVLKRWSDEAAGTARTIWEDIQGLGLDQSRRHSEFIRRMHDYYTKGPGKHLNFVGRLGDKRRAIDTLDAMAGALEDAAFSGPEAVGAEFREIGKVLASPAKYSLRLHDGLNRYVNSASSSYAWHGTGLGNEIMDIVEAPNTFGHAPHLESYVMDDLLPHLQGVKTSSQMARSLNFSVQKERIGNWLKNHPLVEQTLGSDRKKWLVDYYEKSMNSPIMASADSLGGAIAQWFHLSTLGLNLGSSAKNALQTLVTTINAPGIGLQGIWRGLRGYGDQEGLIVKAGRYIEYMGSGIDHTRAFQAAFPEFVADAGDAVKVVDSMLAGDMAAGGLSKIVSPGAFNTVKNTLMAPFATTEAGNRLLAYYSGRNSHLFHNAARYVGASAEGKSALLKEAGEVGQALNMLGNFTGGPLGLPKAIMNMNPLWRQFMHFPIRLTGFLTGSLRLGADPNKLDWGTMGRALAGSTTAYLAARDLLGVDLSGSLITGALPVPQYENNPFYPFPLVPPVAQVLGTGVEALAKGDPSELGDAAAMLVPGGIAIKRAYRTLAPRYADYTNPTPEGRIPLYSTNKSLIGTLTPFEISLRAIGLKPTSISAEAGAAQWLLSQRDRIRQYRKVYTESLAQNDTSKAEKVNAEFQKVYPELGPIQIKKSDIRSLENRKQISRLTRIEKGLPTAYRPLFTHVITEAGLGTMIEDVETGGYPALQNYLPTQ